MAATIVVEMVYKKSTPGTHVYENPKGVAVKTLYVDRIALPQPPPQLLRATLEFGG